jgi:hypothetical protein
VKAMELEIKDNMAKLGFTVMRLNIMNVDIPAKFNAAIKKTAIVKQN